LGAGRSGRTDDTLLLVRRADGVPIVTTVIIVLSTVTLVADPRGSRRASRLYDMTTGVIDQLLASRAGGFIPKPALAITPGLAGLTGPIL